MRLLRVSSGWVNTASRSRASSDGGTTPLPTSRLRARVRLRSASPALLRNDSLPNSCFTSDGE